MRGLGAANMAHSSTATAGAPMPKRHRASNEASIVNPQKASAITATISRANSSTSMAALYMGSNLADAGDRDVLEIGVLQVPDDRNVIAGNLIKRLVRRVRPAR